MAGSLCVTYKRQQGFSQRTHNDVIVFEKHFSFFYQSYMQTVCLYCPGIVGLFLVIKPAWKPFDKYKSLFSLGLSHE